MTYQWHIFLASLDPAKGSEQVGKRPIALCYQIRTLDKSRLGRNFGEVSDENLRREIINALRFQLDM